MQSRWKQTEILLNAARVILEAEQPTTIRQLFCQRVSVRVIENSLADYRRVSAVMTETRENGFKGGGNPLEG